MFLQMGTSHPIYKRPYWFYAAFCGTCGNAYVDTINPNRPTCWSCQEANLQPAFVIGELV